MKAPKEGSCDPIAPLELPHAMHAFHRVSSTDKLNMVSYMYFLMKVKMLVKQQSS